MSRTWTQYMDRACRLEDEARRLRRRAEAVRCTARDSGGARCTHNAHHAPNGHKVDPEVTRTYGDE